MTRMQNTYYQDIATSGTMLPAPGERIHLPRLAPDVHQAMIALAEAASDGLDPAVAALIRMRSSQLNGCASGVDRHVGAARRVGLSEQKIIAVAAWRATPFFTVRERAALALAESVARPGAVPDEVFDGAARAFDEDELARVIAMTVAAHAWDRLDAVTHRSPRDPRPHGRQHPHRDPAPGTPDEPANC